MYFCILIFYFCISIYISTQKKGELIPPAKREHVVCIIDGKHLSALQANVLPLNYYKWPKKRDIHQFDSAINQSLNNFICCISQWMFEPSLQFQSSQLHPKPKKTITENNSEYFLSLKIPFNTLYASLPACLKGEKLPPTFTHFSTG